MLYLENSLLVRVILLKYNFADITNEEIYEDCRVMIVTGPYNIFNNIVIDELKKRTIEDEKVEENEDLLAEFGVSVSAELKVSNSVDFETFMEVVNMPNVNGKWFCAVDITSIPKKSRELLKKYITNPSINGILVVYSTNFKDYMEFLRNKTINQSKNSHVIQLSFPNRTVLKQLVRQLFEDRNVKIKDKSVELFVMRLSNSYDDYEEVIDEISNGREGTELTYEEVAEGLKGIQNFILDDLIYRLLIPVTSNKTTVNKKVYQMMYVLSSEYGPDKLVSKLRYKINDYIEFRVAINSGLIPIKVKYSVDEVKKRLGEESRLSNISDFQFRRMAHIASQTSLKDWVYMRLILNNVTNRYNSESYEKVLYSLVNRSNLGNIRLNNDIGLEESINLEVDRVNEVVYMEIEDIRKLFTDKTGIEIPDEKLD